MAEKKVFNPFYGLLVVVGTMFAITSCWYGVMMVQLLDPARAMAAQLEPSSSVTFFNRYGLTILVAELAVLAVATVGAIGTDDYWQRRATPKQVLPDSGEHAKTAAEDVVN